jgi:BCD family chlorophyll transporter-like MFS transporter
MFFFEKKNQKTFDLGTEMVERAPSNGAKVFVRSLQKAHTFFLNFWRGKGSFLMPFADVATEELPWRKLIRLALFQISVGFSAALIIGTLNRVMIVELHLSAALVSVMISLPLVLAPLRTVVGFKSDQHRSEFGWKRLPYLWFGTLMQWGGLAIMPFALIVLSGDSHAPHFVGPVAASLAFLLVGAGMHTTQTAGLALATDMAPEETRPRVVGMLCVMLLLGICAGALGYGALLHHFSELRLVQVVQGSAVVTLFINGFAMWQQEPRRAPQPKSATPLPTLAEAWEMFCAEPKSLRRLVTIGFGTMALSMQDVLLEPYGGQILHLSVSQTTLLTAALASGGLTGLAVASRRLSRGADPFRIAATGLLSGLAAFVSVIASAGLNFPPLFAAGVFLIGFSSGLFLVGTLADAMSRAKGGMSGLALGAWGSVQAVAAGSAIAIGGILRDYVGSYGGAAASGYDAVYLLEIILIFVTLVALGPLVRTGIRPGFALPQPIKT